MTEEIYICAYCHSEMHVTIGGYPCRGQRIICPGTEYVEHKELERDISRLEKLNRKINDFKNYIKRVKDNEDAKKELCQLNVEKKVLDFKIQDFREKFSKKLKSDKDFKENKTINLEYIISYSEIAFPNLHLD
jgi:hypothetical protein